MNMERIVQAELLDELPPSDPGAQHSRRDLRRINGLMGNARHLRSAVQLCLPRVTGRPWRVLEVGAGDGTLAARVWSRLPRPPLESRLLLLDRLSVVDDAARDRLQSHGWHLEIQVMPVEEWLASTAPDSLDLVYANLFAHHFDRNGLPILLNGIARRSRAVVLVEPRRSPMSLLGARLLWGIGSHAITRHDAVRSVEAGFCAEELTDLWPNRANWILSESRAGLFGHRFIARRRTDSVSE